MTQKTGALIFDETADRYDIRFDVNDYYGGLHCGDCFEVFVRGKWKPTRMEYGDNWYLVGIRAADLSGLLLPPHGAAATTKTRSRRRSIAARCMRRAFRLSARRSISPFSSMTPFQRNICRPLGAVVRAAEIIIRNN